MQGSGQQRRTFLFVSDAARAFELILRCGVVGQTYNIGGDEEKTVLQVAEDVIALITPEAATPTFVQVDDRPYNDQRYIARAMPSIVSCFQPCACLFRVHLDSRSHHAGLGGLN